MRWKKIAAALLLCVISLGASAAENKTILALSEPYEGAAHADGSGFYFDLVRLVYEPLGYTIQTDTAPYARAVKIVMSNKADLWCASYEAEEQTHYPKSAMDADMVEMIYKKGALDGTAGAKALEGKKSAWIIGYNYHEYLTGVKMEFQEVKSRKIGFNLLEAGRIDAFLDSTSEIDITAKAENIDLSPFERAMILELRLYMAFRPDERGKELAELWDRRTKELHDAGTLKPFYEKGGYTDFYPFK